VQRTLEAATIRPVTPADVPGVRDVLVTTWHATYDATLGVDQVNAITAAWHGQEALERQCHTPGAAFLLAEIDGRVVATAYAKPRREKGIELSQLYVHPDAQARGLGSRLLAAVLAPFPKGTTIRLEVEPRNTRAIAFYERAGFRVIGQADDCGGCGSRIRHLVLEGYVP
jgi:ribosomal protein S18 acetylase RimI-like enzyme